MNTELFKKIISGEVACEKVYEDEDAFAFLDINPVNPGHTLVIPKKWSSGFLDADRDTICKLIPVIQKVAKAVKAATGAEGVNIVQNDGEAAGQKIFHLHFHIIPRFSQDGHVHWEHQPYPSKADEQAMGVKVRAAITPKAG